MLLFICLVTVGHDFEEKRMATARQKKVEKVMQQKDQRPQAGDRDRNVGIRPIAAQEGRLRKAADSFDCLRARRYSTLISPR
jgi:hypothetical protein